MPHQAPGAVHGGPRAFLRVDGLVVLVAGVAAFFAMDQPWWLLPALLLLPDVFMVGYARSTRTGALLYNVAHSYAMPALLGLVGVQSGAPLLQALSVIWFAHIGMDRAFGYGLKYDTGFKDTHLGPIGRG